MIKANELRIGNWVNDKIGLVTIGENGKINFADVYEPIPLTPEILEKCGFKTNKLQNLFKRVKEKTEGMKSEIHLGDYYDERKYYYLVGLNIRIIYLHQLQNLYFALTNEELIINL